MSLKSPTWVEIEEAEDARIEAEMERRRMAAEHKHPATTSLTSPTWAEIEEAEDARIDAEMKRSRMAAETEAEMKRSRMAADHSATTSRPNGPNGRKTSTVPTALVSVSVPVYSPHAVNAPDTKQADHKGRAVQSTPEKVRCPDPSIHNARPIARAIAVFANSSLDDKEPAGSLSAATRDSKDEKKGVATTPAPLPRFRVVEIGSGDRGFVCKCLIAEENIFAIESTEERSSSPGHGNFRSFELLYDFFLSELKARNHLALRAALEKFTVVLQSDAAADKASLTNASIDVHTEGVIILDAEDKKETPSEFDWLLVSSVMSATIDHARRRTRVDLPHERIHTSHYCTGNLLRPGLGFGEDFRRDAIVTVNTDLNSYTKTRRDAILETLMVKAIQFASGAGVFFNDFRGRRFARDEHQNDPGLATFGKIWKCPMYANGPKGKRTYQKWKHVRAQLLTRSLSTDALHFYRSYFKAVLRIELPRDLPPLTRYSLFQSPHGMEWLVLYPKRFDDTHKTPNWYVRSMMGERSLSDQLAEIRKLKRIQPLDEKKTAWFDVPGEGGGKYKDVTSPPVTEQEARHRLLVAFLDRKLRGMLTRPGGRQTRAQEENAQAERDEVRRIVVIVEVPPSIPLIQMSKGDLSFRNAMQVARIGMKLTLEGGGFELSSIKMAEVNGCMYTMYTALHRYVIDQELKGVTIFRLFEKELLPVDDDRRNEIDGNVFQFDPPPSRLYEKDDVKKATDSKEREGDRKRVATNNTLVEYAYVHFTLDWGGQPKRPADALKILQDLTQQLRTLNKVIQDAKNKLTRPLLISFAIPGRSRQSQTKDKTANVWHDNPRFVEDKDEGEWFQHDLNQVHSHPSTVTKYVLSLLSRDKDASAAATTLFSTLELHDAKQPVGLDSTRRQPSTKVFMVPVGPLAVIYVAVLPSASPQQQRAWFDGLDARLSKEVKEQYLLKPITEGMVQSVSTLDPKDKKKKHRTLKSRMPLPSASRDAVYAAAFPGSKKKKKEATEPLIILV
jgi:hypothetical protein